ncbi:uncharacterized protein LOC134246859 [Saccostrea cucullata]|uniref:uncharacterized protein LOC134246859 n=1 Tax=Saccostrea cuccullata TaxID=36930 RepID=UPI002ED3CD9C
MAGLIISEAFCDAKDNKEQLILQTFDAEKAFDVVWHENLLCKLYKDGIEGDLWNLVKSLHTDAHTIVKWNENLSQEIKLEQGIRQGAKLSTLMYKRFNNDLLNALQTVPEGVKIGTLDITAPTCADDIALLTKNQRDAQILTNLVNTASNKDRFTINSAKCEILTFKTHQKKYQQEIEVKLGNETINHVSSLKHLGIERNSTNTPDVSQRIETARRTLYALLGSGMHGKNGLSPVITLNMWTTFVIPRLLHGIELLNIRKIDLEKLEKYQRKVLKQLQSLPDRTASIATLSLIGAKTIEAHIDARIITTFLNIAKDPATIEHQMAVRQLLTKSDNSACWFIRAKSTLEKYDLPDPLYLLRNIKSNEEAKHWKQKVKKQISDYWQIKNEIGISEKVSLQHLKLQTNSCRQPHPLWQSSTFSPKASNKAIVKAQLATNTYRLQDNINKFNQHKVKNDCLLCREITEDRLHFLLKCPTLDSIRKPYLTKIVHYLQEKIGTHESNSYLLEDTRLLQIIIDPSYFTFSDIPSRNNKIQIFLENLSRNMVFALHCHRAQIIKKISTQSTTNRP